jgi:MFS family permease
MVLLALFGATMGQGVVWYTGQFYAQTFLLKIMNIEFDQANKLLIIALMMGTPFFVLFGWLSDKIGRKPIMLAGMLLAVVCYRPIYEKMYQTGNLKNKVEIVADTKVEVKRDLAPKSTTDSLITTTTTKAYEDGATYKEVSKLTILAGKAEADQPKADVTKTIKLNDANTWTLIWMIFIQLIFVTMAYGPIAAFLVELFPVKIRYTSMSLPYHIGNGIFGGLMPAIATYLVTTAKDANTVAEKAGQAIVNAQPYLEGLKYPMIVAAICFVIGLIYIKEDKSVRD